MEQINLDTVDLLDKSISIDLSNNATDLALDDNYIGTSMAGAELLMNTNTKKSSPVTDFNIDDLSSLEEDLNSLSMSPNDGENNNTSAPIKLNIDDDIKSSHQPIPIKTNTGEPEKTWDGYQQFNNIPIDPDKKVNMESKMSREEMLREKFNYVRKFEALEKNGVRVSKQYTMESSLDEMIGEYETIKNEKEQNNSMKFQGKMLMAAVTGLEFLNSKFDPFDFKLDGWGEQVNENMEDYDDIFGELHQKYSSKATMAPELKLLFQLSGSAIMLHMTNSMFKSSMPGMDDVLRQNPELMQQFTQAAANKMGEDKPGFGNFMNDVISQQASKGASQPPPPVKTRPPPRMDNFARPDIGFGRGGPEPGVDVSKSFENPSNIQRSERKPRPEMKGPSNDIDQLLSGLKTKPIISKRASPINFNTSNKKRSPPTSKNKRRPISDKNTISLDF